MSVFLMGVYDKSRDKFCTVAKCGNGHDDATLSRLQRELDMVKISKVSTCGAWVYIWGSYIPIILVMVTFISFFLLSFYTRQSASKVPSWLLVNKSLIPDLVVKDPKVGHL